MRAGALIIMAIAVWAGWHWRQLWQSHQDVISNIARLRGSRRVRWQSLLRAVVAALVVAAVAAAIR